MKRILATILSIGLILVYSAAVFGYQEETSLSYVISPNGTSYYVAGLGNVNEKDIVVPDYYNGLPVTAVAARAFENTDIRSIYLGPNISLIGEFAFANANELSLVVMKDSVKNLRKGCFYNCLSLETIELHEGLLSIDDWAFWNSGLKEITIPSTISAGAIGVFAGCENLESVNIKNGLTALGIYYFADCVSLENITLPESIEVINEYAFAECYNLKDMTIISGRLGINDLAFYEDEFTIHYPCNNGSWEGYRFKDAGGSVTWQKHLGIKHVEYKAPTDTSTGNIEYWYCDECGKTFSDVQGINEILKTSVTIPALQSMRGDVDGNGLVNEDDVLTSLYHLFFGDEYSVNQNIDFNGDGIENEDDVLQLLYHVFFEDEYPIV